ncbi:MAG: 30S ribosomal protein S20 [Melioribacteraceae bacterium]|nr:30S ribosomal protein S20 [Melioribacteraceae bacterium]
MANHKSAKKRIKTSEKRRVMNKAAASKIKTLIKKVQTAKEKETAAVLLKDAVSYIDKNVSKGRLHKNTAARKKSSLTKFVNGLK